MTVCEIGALTIVFGLLIYSAFTIWIDWNHPSFPKWEDINAKANMKE